MTADAYAPLGRIHVCWCGQAYVERTGVNPHKCHSTLVITTPRKEER